MASPSPSRPTYEGAWAKRMEEIGGLGYQKAYATSYSQPLTITLFFIQVISAITIIALMFRRRHFFPLNVAPFWLQAGGLIGTATTMLATTHFEALELRGNCIMWWLVYPICGWFPFVTSMFLILWNVQVSYALQLIRVNQKKGYRKIYIWSSRPRVLYYQYFTVGALLTLPQMLLFYLDTRMPGFDDISCRPNWEPAAAFFFGQPFAAAIFVMYLGVRMRHVQEEFQLTRNFAKMALVFFCLPIPLRMVHTMFEQHIPLETLKHTKAVEVIFWFIALMGYLYFTGYSSWRLSYDKELRAKSSRRTSAATITPLKEREGENQRVKIDSSSKLKELLSDSQIREPFGKYCTREFCVENVLFLDALFSLRAILQGEEREEKKEEREKVLKSLRVDFFENGSLNEINVSMALRQKTRDALGRWAGAVSGGERETEKQREKEADDLLLQCEREVLKMLLAPFNRFLEKDTVVYEIVVSSPIIVLNGDGNRKDSALH